MARSLPLTMGTKIVLVGFKPLQKMKLTRNLDSHSTCRVGDPVEDDIKIEASYVPSGSFHLTPTLFNPPTPPDIDSFLSKAITSTWTYQDGKKRMSC